VCKGEQEEGRAGKGVEEERCDRRRGMNAKATCRQWPTAREGVLLAYPVDALVRHSGDLRALRAWAI
jgi:hypothetical protein